ncbi:hypothetical protein CTAYLR_010703 [Chrysophaeum taylorii]|uniref:Homologous recombination OB-fold protein OB-fold domain-containing protein n=1 Tax=Chrysophaeum taylorii TaxID=2483200 RepID=A0AAD7XMG1_9STRA|nr:hypothetical protein CTAYLR_010703 [Chrysophaeum taylorii]
MYFDKVPWRVAMESLDLLHGVEGQRGMSDLSSASKVASGARLPLMVVVVDSLGHKNMDADGIATVMDRTGRMTAHIHKGLLSSEFVADVRPGTVLILNNTVVVATRTSRSLNILVENVLVALPPDTPAPPNWGRARAPAAEPAVAAVTTTTTTTTSSRVVEPLPAAWIERWCELGCGVEVPTTWADIVKAAAATLDLDAARDSCKREIEREPEAYELALEMFENALAVRKGRSVASRPTHRGTPCFCGSSDIFEALCLECGREKFVPKRLPELQSDAQSYGDTRQPELQRPSVPATFERAPTSSAEKNTPRTLAAPSPTQPAPRTLAQPPAPSQWPAQPPPRTFAAQPPAPRSSSTRPRAQPPNAPRPQPRQSFQQTGRTPPLEWPPPYLRRYVDPPDPTARQQERSPQQNRVFPETASSLAELFYGEELVSSGYCEEMTARLKEVLRMTGVDDVVLPTGMGEVAIVEKLLDDFEAEMANEPDLPPMNERVYFRDEAESKEFADAVLGTIRRHMPPEDRFPESAAAAGAGLADGS